MGTAITLIRASQMEKLKLREVRLSEATQSVAEQRL